MAPVRTIPVADWVAAASALREDGFTLLDVLAGVDRGGERELFLRVIDPAGRRAQTLTTRVPANDPQVPSLSGVWPGALWQEREIAESMGVIFPGNPDPRPLLLREVPSSPPLLKSTPLPERLSTVWPGAVDNPERQRRRPQVPPGVRPDWVTDGEES